MYNNKEYSWKAEFADCYLLFSSQRLHLSWGRKKKKVLFDNLGPKVVFLPAKINGYRRREKEWEGEARTSLRTPLSPGKFFSCLMELNWQEFSHWGEVKGERQLRCHGWKHLSSQFTKNRLQGEGNQSCSFSALFKRSWRPMDPFVSSLCWSGLDLDTLQFLKRSLSHRSARLLSVSSLALPPVIPVGESYSGIVADAFLIECKTSKSNMLYTL